MVTLFIKAKGTRTLKLDVREVRKEVKYGPNLSAMKPGRIRPKAEDPLTMERR